MRLNKRACALVWACAWLCACVCASAPFRVYWNVPSHLCVGHGVYVNVSQYGLLQNAGDAFHGEKVTILYGPGEFPYLKEDAEGEWQPVNGGVPQAGSLTSHGQAFLNTLNSLVPTDFKGAAVLDFEDYYPSLQLSAPQYKNASRAWVRARHPTWSPAEVDQESYASFNASAKDFFKTLLWVGREARPGALWGYYHYPYCHDYSPGEHVCRPKTQEMNDALAWLFEGSAALYPSLYVFKGAGFSPSTRRLHAAAALEEADRVRQKVNSTAPVLPYVWYRYHDDPAFLSPVDVVNTLGIARLWGTGGAVVWGASKDMATREQCLALKNYAEGQLGPLVRYLAHLPCAKLHHILTSRRRLRRRVKKVLGKIRRRKGRKGKRRGRRRGRKEGNGGGRGGGEFC